MTRNVGGRSVRFLFLASILPAVVWAPAASASAEHPLEPPDRSSPRATLDTFRSSIDRAWNLYSNEGPGFEKPLRIARQCLDLSEVPPLVLREVSAESALLLKEVLDRIELPPPGEIPDRAAIEELGLTRWTVPHTEIALLRIEDGERRGEWVFSPGTIDRADEFYDRVRHLPYRPGRTGGHIAELRGGSDAAYLMKLVRVMPPWFRAEIGDMLVWQWFGLAVLISLLVLGMLLVAWLGRRWRSAEWPGHRLASYLVPLALMCLPYAGRYMIARLLTLPGTPASLVRLLMSVVGYVGLAWLSAVLVIRIGDLAVRFWFRDARPLKKQLVRVIFRIATICIVTGVIVNALRSLGAPVGGLIAGLGVGGLAIALAAQSTLENFIGGVILYADQPVKVGDVCRFGKVRGTVEDVGLRSVKVRTLDGTVLSVPNADFAKQPLENLTERSRVLLREQLCLRYETSRAQLRRVLEELDSMLLEHPRIADEWRRVRFTGFGSYFLEIEIFAYVLTDAYPEFLEVRQDVLMKVIEIVERSGTRLALPTEIHYVSGEAAAD